MLIIVSGTGIRRAYAYNSDPALAAELVIEYITGSQQPAEALYYFHNDHLGTSQAMTDENQNIVWQAAYKPFGGVSIVTASIENNLRFPGQYFDAESGLYYNFFRDYDPGIGRYVQSDPIGLRGGFNTYGYVGGNPIIWIDPNGLVRWGDLAFGAVDFALSTSEAALGIGLMIASPTGGPVAPVPFIAGLTSATHGSIGMFNSAQAIQDALYDSSTPGLFETLGGLACEDAAKVGAGLDLFSGIRPGAMSAAAMANIGDVYNAASGLNTMNNEFGNDR
jgi:RHS repeat-associated protein